jgi:hypothetical protein
MGFTYGK